jgi:exopolysaccharide biosynthesis polyprenyl glycosylphosphotransferase
MNHSDLFKRRRLKVVVDGAIDATLFFLAFVAGTFLRLGLDLGKQKFLVLLPGIVGAAFVFVCAAYIVGLYDRSPGRPRTRYALALPICLGLATTVMVALFYAVGTTIQVGRGILAISALLAYAGCLVHHARLVRSRRTERERTAVLVSGPEDEQRVRQMVNSWSHHLHFVGLVYCGDYVPHEGLRVLGPVSQFVEIAGREHIERLVCTEEILHDPALRQPLSTALYSGIAVTPLLVVCEEIHQCVPLELVRPEWLLHASSQPERFYLLKIKRAFDILVSLALLVLSAPVLLLGMLLVRLTSPGPVFYHQTRCGRFGRLIRLRKLRTMRVDAESAGAVWAARSEARLTPVGGFLRKYRIDELIQLLSVLKGEMSFVGPRPERPEFMAELEEQIPGFGDRLLIHPGLTGWAQVNYPYGASMEDARRKLEFDLYYMKHMSLTLDLFILLDTVRTVLWGGVHHPQPTLRFAAPPARAADRQGTCTDGLQPGLPACSPQLTNLDSSPGYLPVERALTDIQ